MAKIKYILWRIKWIYKHIKLALSTRYYDYGYLNNYMLFFLKELQKTLIEDDLHIHEPTAIKSINLAVKLLEKTKEEYTKFSDLHDKKWGKIVLDSVPTKEGNFRLIIRRPLARTELDRVLERKEFILAIERDDRMYKRDYDRALQIISKYRTSWWT